MRDFGIYEKLRKLNISKTLFETLLKIYEKNIWITAEELSGYIGLSRRTASRILIKLEENCLADMTLEEGVIGRPAKKWLKSHLHFLFMDNLLYAIIFHINIILAL